MAEKTREQLRRELAQAQQRIAELEISEKRLQDVVKSTTGWIWEVDHQGTYTYCSKKIEDILGYTIAEVLGKTPFEFMIPEEAARTGEIFGDIVAEKAPIVDLENWNLTKDGREVCLLTNGVPMLDEAGNLCGYRGVDLDITEQKRAEETLQASEERWRRVIDNMAVMFDAMDEHGNIIMWNRECERVTGFSAEEIVGNPKAVELLYPNEEYRQEMFGKWAERSEDFLNWEWDITCKDGRVKTIAWSKVSDRVPIPDWPSWYTGVDVTARRLAEQERAELQQQIIQELSTPIIPVMQGIIVMPLVGIIDTKRARDITRTLLAGISEHRARVVILDITGVPMVDSNVAAHLDKTIQAARLKGARVIITGISDAVAEAIVDLGINWSKLETLRDLQTGLIVALNSMGVTLTGREI